MPTLLDMQTEFSAAVLDAVRPAPAGLDGPRQAGRRRFDVYRNNVVVGLIDVLKGHFPVVARLVGDEFFAATARVYVATDPPCSPILSRYGSGFPGFLSGFGPVGDLPWLPDVARLEWLQVRAYNAADRRPIDAALLASIPSGAVGDLRFELQPSTGLVASPWPIYSIWRTNAHDAEVESIDAASPGEAALVVRPDLETVTMRLPTGAHAFVKSLGDGETLAEAYASAKGEAPDFDVERALAALIDVGAIVAVHAAITGDEHRQHEGGERK